jgi:hypothetical protein
MVVDACIQRIETDGFAILPGVYSQDEVAEILAQIEAAIATDEVGGPLRATSGTIYAARNILILWPRAKEIWKQPTIINFLRQVLGREFGLVRVLYFDKPPGQSWALPWHKDATIAVRDNRLPSSYFGKPTTKGGIPHVQAPQPLLEKMLTLRIHLDDITEKNGPLKVMAGSHRGVETRPVVTVLGGAGDVLLMRPLVSHCSNGSHPQTNRHRRILHLEFAGTPLLPDGYAWHDYWK